MRKNIIAANWKMNGSLDFNNNWFEEFYNLLKNNNKDFNNIEIIIAPSFLYIEQINNLRTYLFNKFDNKFKIKLATQDISEYENGAYTGQVSVSMVKDFDVDYVIVGHSERRSLNNENNFEVARKTRKALENNLKVIACIGETLEQRENNQTKIIVGEQLDSIIELCSDVNNLSSNLVIAYEPVWAIGTGVNASPEQAQEVHSFLREKLAKYNKEFNNITILYGGSVKPNNAKELFNQQDIDGGLIGGASLNAKSFMEICLAAL